MRNMSLTRAFEDILEIARRSPSGVETQPWQLFVLGNSSIDRLRQTLKENMASVCQSICQSHPSLGVDQIGQALQIPNGSLSAFAALDTRLGRGAELDLGIFLQSVRLLANDRGLVADVQSVWPLVSHLVGEAIKLPEDTKIVCGVTLRMPGVADNVESIHISLAQVIWLD